MAVSEIASAVMPMKSAEFVIELDGQINPNDAPVASLVRLPQIGTVRAETIVAYREKFARLNDSRLAFKSCDDLLLVKGIGPKTVQSICGFLKFD